MRSNEESLPPHVAQPSTPGARQAVGPGSCRSGALPRERGLESSARLVRRCTVCGASLEGRDPRARTCTTSCRREAGRLPGLLDGRSDGPYSTLGQLVQRASRVRANRPERGLSRAPLSKERSGLGGPAHRAGQRRARRERRRASSRTVGGLDTRASTSTALPPARFWPDGSDAAGALFGGTSAA